MVAELYTVVYPTSVTLATAGDQTTTAVGASPQWTSEDGDTSYISFLPGSSYSIATFPIGVSSCPGLTQDWFLDPYIIMHNQEMGFQAGDPYWYIYFEVLGNVLSVPGYPAYQTAVLQAYFEAYRGLYFVGESNYATNVWHVRTPAPGPDPLDPHGMEIDVPGYGLYSTFVQYGFTNEFLYGSDLAAEMYQFYLADALQVSFWCGGGSGDQLPDDEMRLSLFGLVLPIPLPDIDGALDVKRRQFWRPRPGW